MAHKCKKVHPWDACDQCMKELDEARDAKTPKFVAGEDLHAGDAVYLRSGDGKLYKIKV